MWKHANMANWVPILIFTLISIAVLAFLLRKNRRNGDPYSLRLPPGPPTVPLFGNLHQLIIGGALPHHTFSKLSENYGPIMRLQLGECLAVVISSSEMAKEILWTKELSFPQRPTVLIAETMSYDLSGLFFTPYGDYWQRVRKICVSELLSAKQVASFRSVREEEVWDLAASISQSAVEKVAINLSEMIFLTTANITSRAAFGKRCGDVGEFLALIAEGIKVAGGFNLPDLFPSLKFLRHVTGMQSELDRIFRRKDPILEDMVEQHKLRAGRVDGRGGGDLLDVLIKLQRSGELDSKLTSNQIKALSLDIFSAGSETAATTMEWAMAELLKSPTAMKKVQTELRQAFKGKPKVEESDLHRHNLTYLGAIIKETLRMHPSGPLIPRECIEPCEVGGYQIPSKAKILINAYAIGRDPNVWPEPHCFKPDRFVGSTVKFMGSDFEWIPFGGGRRICPGISFATANIELLLAQMLYHFDWSLPEGMNKAGEVDMSEKFSITARKKDNLVLVPTISVPFSIS